MYSLIQSCINVLSRTFCRISIASEHRYIDMLVNVIYVILCVCVYQVCGVCVHVQVCVWCVCVGGCVCVCDIPLNIICFAIVLFF